MTRRLTLAETELTDEIRRRGWLTSSTGAYRTGRGVEAPNGRGTEIKPLKPAMLWVACWCESYERWVPEDEVAAGRTWQCANRDCHPPGESRPVFYESDPDLAIHYDPPGTRRRSPTEAYSTTRLFDDRGNFRPRPPPVPLQDQYPLDPEFAAALQVTGANRLEGLWAARCAAAQAGYHGENARATIIWYAKALQGQG